MNRPLLLLAALLPIAGCSAQRPAQPPPAEEKSEEQRALEASPLLYRSPQLVRQRPDTLLAAGKLPLAHLFDVGGPVRIVNATSNAILLEQTLPPRTIIGVSATGILVGQEKVLSSRLSPEHRYEIWWRGDR